MGQEVNQMSWKVILGGELKKVESNKSGAESNELVGELNKSEGESNSSGGKSTNVTRLE